MKNSRTQIIVIILLLVVIGVGVWLGYLRKTSSGNDGNSHSNVSETSVKGQEDSKTTFRESAYKLKPGDKAGIMKVVSVEPYNPDFSELSPDNVLATFSGAATVEGTYNYYHSDFDGGWVLDFTVSTSTSDLPFIDQRYPVFQFTNQEEAEQIFGIFPGTPKKKDVQIRIQGYRLENYPSEVSDETTLVSVE